MPPIALIYQPQVQTDTKERPQNRLEGTGPYGATLKQGMLSRPLDDAQKLLPVILISKSDIEIKGHVEASLVVRSLENDGVIEFETESEDDVIIEPIDGMKMVNNRGAGLDAAPGLAAAQMIAHTTQIRTSELRRTRLEKAANTPGSRKQAEWYESDDGNGNSSDIVLGDSDLDMPRIKTFHHLCLRGLEILAQISSLEEFRTYFARLETWSFGLMGVTDGRPDKMSLDDIFRPGNESLRFSSVPSVTAGYSMIVGRFLKILLYIESLLITIEPDSSDAVSYLNLLQDFFELSTVATMLQEFPLQDLDEAKTFMSKVMACVSGIEDQVQRIYDILPAIGSTRQIYCFSGVSETLGHVTTSSRELARQKATRYEDKSDPQDLVGFNIQLSKAVVASLRE